jgi:cholesterol oxidase
VVPGTLCGDCNTGCNVGAKNTVLMNYLPAAHKSGALIFCNLEVSYIEKIPSADSGSADSVDVDADAEADGGSEDEWVVHCLTTDPAFDPPREIVITTKTLILAAGTLGTTEILLRSREQVRL